MTSLTKTGSLIIIDKKLKNLVPKFIFFEKKKFLEKKNFYINKINRTFNNDIIIRSSAINEDSKKESKAGFYDSFIIKKNNFSSIEDKIIEIIKKFKNDKDQILIQKYIKEPEISGVVFTKDKTSNSHYYDINYDTSKKTFLITSGKNNPTIKSLIIFKNSKNIPKKFRELINILRNLENIFDNDRLDVEFCIKNKKVFIFQCRPLLGSKKIINKKTLKEIIINLKKKFTKINTHNETLFGKKTVLSNMSDWNPAEIIGKKPTKLSFSLYAELITNSIWAIQRKNYGYKDVLPNNLMLSFAGSPFIDLRVDLNSFLPNGLNDSISEKLIDFFIREIKKKPEIHDKIEFKLVNTCFDFSLKKNNKLPLSNQEKNIYFSLLKKLTNNILNPKNKFIENELNKIEILEKKIKTIKKSKLSHIQKIYYLIEDCKKYGTIAFAGIARCAFISKSILDSLKENLYIDDKDLDNFYLSINTISKSLNREYFFSKKKNSFKKFLNEYGHLRPSTYSIRTENYKENYKNYFSKNIHFSPNFKNKFFIDKNKITKINKLFKKNNIIINFNQFIKFSKLAIEKREYAKLIFSKSIDEIFKNLTKLSNEININSKLLEHLDINIILKSFYDLEQEKLRKIMLKNIHFNQKSYKFLQNILLPDIILENNDISFFYNLNCKENYITNKNCLGQIIELKKLNHLKNLDQKIILIENADPGFDFLFSYNIAGLITKYGGSNSHMAIRCMELGLPAIIGVGEKTYEKFANSRKIYFDCNNKKYSIIY
jgi:phosphohistidine swiveling domain-containing protein